MSIGFIWFQSGVKEASIVLVILLWMSRIDAL